MNKKPSKKEARDSYLQINIIIATALLDGICSISTLADFLIGKRSVAIKEYGIADKGVFASCKDYSELEVSTEIENAIFDGLLVRANDGSTNFLASNKGIKKIGIKPKPLEIKKAKVGDAESEKLFKELKDLRKEIASLENIQERSVTTDKTLRLIAIQKPTSDSTLNSVKGVGKVFVSRYGDKFLKRIKKYNDKGSKKSAKKSKSSIREMTIVDKVVKLIKDGKDIIDIAKALSISNGAVAKALQEAIEADIKLEKSTFFLKSEYSKVLNTVKKNPRAPLSEIRAKSKLDMEFALLRVAVAFARKDLELQE